ncbi:Two-component response regulator ARR14 [Camellia lanceoleosa]|uniref:Two-component response regulator ARR14 n=1 Tax=Camellia lanceoleosa TaxID=1840588 RepID=A0ACC0HQ38_9ERIC|nr:Two-component response regulator ARR14 [Camellia lanceoleosa]
MSKIEVVHVSLNRAAPPQSRVNANFPEGLRVLVVDDNVVCLKLVAALLNKCRYKEAVPKKILDIMNEPEISRGSVASHLQKYRNALRKENTKAKMSQESENNINSNKTNGLLSNTITTSCINQGLNTINHHNRLAEQDMSTGITSFGGQLQKFGASTSNAKLLQQNQLPPKVVEDQVRPTVLGSVPPSPFFAANPSSHHEFNGMRFHSINSRTKMFDDNVKMSSS